ncbi:MAG: electron transfer flavoprotein subunit beta/FixA family protein [Deltaproteobacteria bacterium]|nr:electron transfer flavoprotein subunit beta/FixA family protein [Deltaproteobacteria bacterium]
MRLKRQSAVRIREKTSGTQVEAITAGPEEAAPVTRRAMGMGADQGIHINLNTGPLFSPEATAAAIARVAVEKGYDLIITGIMSEDRMARQTGRMIAGFLGYSCATGVIMEKIDPQSMTIEVERELEGGVREKARLALPAVITVQTGINTPRYPALSRMLAANRAEIDTINMASAETCLPASRIIDFADPEQTRAGLVLKGNTGKKAEELIRILKDKALL